MVSKLEVVAPVLHPVNRLNRGTEFLNAYEIVNAAELKWSVSVYKVVRLDGYASGHENRGKNKDIIWGLKNIHKALCRGYGFVIDVDETTVAIPSTWDIPSQENFEGYSVTFERSFIARATDIKHKTIVSGILRESIKRHFKDVTSAEIGAVWQDYGDFCQSLITNEPKDEIAFCRKFNVSVELLQGRRWVMQMAISTKTIDIRTLADYYRTGEVKLLAQMLQLKLVNRSTRKNEATAIRVLHVSSPTQIEVLELEKPDEIINVHTRLDPADQQSISNQKIRCARFRKPPLEIPMSEIRLILDTQITQENHDETIINPCDRAKWHVILRTFLDRMDAYESTIRLAENPISVTEFDTIVILPPALQVRIAPDQTDVLPAVAEPTHYALRDRAKERVRLIRQHGFLEQRPINPLIACPRSFGERRARRLVSDLNWLIKHQGFEFQFADLCMYGTVYDIRRAVQEGEHDTLFAVLPESYREANSDNDMHERIKKEIPVPSQCIYHDNTLPVEWVEKSWRAFKSEKLSLARRIQDRYQLCVWNLLVKHHWVPFAPVDPFHYNVHVGIDVGGKHNNRVMACIGYGFQRPKDGLVFLPWHINVEAQQAEPIPTSSLYIGLKTLFEELHQRLSEAGVIPDFEKVLFFRDGELRGHGDEWNEADVLEQLRKEFYKQQWISEDALWTTAEVSKRAGYWRILRNENPSVYNPIVGRCVFPFNDSNVALVCTTGSPYLSHGTASPLLVRIKDVYGNATREDVIRDLVWEADMCFTKVDMGRSLPWVLHVANTGALQQSKAYRISGVTT